MLFIDPIVAAAMWLQPSYFDHETKEERHPRMTIIATAIDRATERAACLGEHKSPKCRRSWKPRASVLAFLLLSQAFFESALQQAVHEGQCGSRQCDPLHVRSGVLVHQAHSLWQIHYHPGGQLVSLEDWRAMHAATQEATDTAAWAATKILVAGMKCDGTLRGAVVFYAHGKCPAEIDPNARPMALAKAAQRVAFAEQLRTRFMAAKPRRGG